MCAARFARDDAYRAAPTALGLTILHVPALPGWADVWRTASGPQQVDLPCSKHDVGHLHICMNTGRGVQESHGREAPMGLADNAYVS